MKTLWIFLFCPMALFGQQLTGIIIDGDSKMPVDFAMVYINGTTIGSMTNTDGNFVLNSPMASGVIVVSHVSYNTEVVSFDQNSKSVITISLTPKVVSFEQVLKTSLSRREKNLQYFKEMFLGNDFWGASAIIENDSVLFFKIEYDDATTKDPLEEKKVKSVEVEAATPIIITLPKIGYTLYYDLIHFSDKVDTILDKRVISSLGYYYYQPMKTSSRIKQRKYHQNRLSAYYYSPLHFLRSLYANNLLENGYILFEESNNTEKLFFLDSCDCTSYNSDEVSISGMKGQKLNIIYFESGESPVDLTKSKGYNKMKKSAVYFNDDVAVVRKDGSSPGGSILFEEGIGKKRIGATLPFDYKPVEKTKKKEAMDSQKMHEHLLKKVRL